MFLNFQFLSVCAIPRLYLRSPKRWDDCRAALKRWEGEEIIVEDEGPETRFYLPHPARARDELSFNASGVDCFSYLIPPSLVPHIEIAFEVRELWSPEGWAQVSCTVSGNRLKASRFASHTQARRTSVHAAFVQRIVLSGPDSEPPPFVSVIASDAGVLQLYEHRFCSHGGAEVLHQVKRLWGIGKPEFVPNRYRMYLDAANAAIRKARESEPNGGGFYLFPGQA